MVGQIDDPAVLASLLPHSGKMCLLQRVLAWDDTSIECRTTSHRNADNPLRHQGELPIQGGIEYAAQAMAIHGTLISKSQDSSESRSAPRTGYLGVLSKVSWYCLRLDDLDGELQVLAKKLMATESGLNYSFSVFHGQRLLLEGQAVVVLRDVP